MYDDKMAGGSKSDCHVYFSLLTSHEYHNR